MASPPPPPPAPRMTDARSVVINYTGTTSIRAAEGQPFANAVSMSTDVVRAYATSTGNFLRLRPQQTGRALVEVDVGTGIRRTYTVYVVGISESANIAGRSATFEASAINEGWTGMAPSGVRVNRSANLTTAVVSASSVTVTFAEDSVVGDEGYVIFRVTVADPADLGTGFRRVRFVRTA